MLAIKTCFTDGCCKITTSAESPVLLSPCPAAPSKVQVCARGTLVALYPQEALTHSAAQAFCKAQLGSTATLVPGADAVVLAAAQKLVAEAGLSPPGEPLWSAAAWVGITRDSGGQWGDASGPLSTLPWCPNEPDSNAKDGAESCSNLLTGCASTGQALLNDFACDKLARVVCALPQASQCGECHLALVPLALSRADSALGPAAAAATVAVWQASVHAAQQASAP
jgi:hypothetical protein